MSEITQFEQGEHDEHGVQDEQEEALRRAYELVGQALKEAEARCAVLGQYINDCDSNRSTTAAGSDAIRELRALQDYRRGLLRRQSLIREALDCAVGERPARVRLASSPDRPVRQVQRQVQIQARRRRS